MKRKLSLVFGGAGFIGSHLCHRLLSLGHEVIAADNLSTGRVENLAEVAAMPNFRFIRYDITCALPTALSSLGSVDEIYNLACPASPRQYQSDPVKTLMTSVAGSLNLLQLARTTGARILLASTSEVYGDPLVSSQNENYFGNVNTTGPRSCYDEGKRAAETLFNDYRRMYGVDTRIIRIFNTYGPRMSADDGRVIPAFITQALKGLPLTVNGDGSQTRSFMYIDDLIDAIILMMANYITHSPVNIGNPVETTIIELADIIKRLTDSTSEIGYRPMPQDDPRRRCPDIARARDALGGWFPTVNLDDGLTATINYFKTSII